MLRLLWSHNKVSPGQDIPCPPAQKIQKFNTQQQKHKIPNALNRHSALLGQLFIFISTKNPFLPHKSLNQGQEGKFLCTENTFSDPQEGLIQTSLSFQGWEWSFLNPQPREHSILTFSTPLLCRRIPLAKRAFPVSSNNFSSSIFPSSSSSWYFSTNLGCKIAFFTLRMSCLRPRKRRKGEAQEYS